MKLILATGLSVAASVAMSDDYDVYRVDCSAAQIAAVSAATEKARELLGKAAAAIPPIESATGQTFQKWFGGPEGDTDPVLKDLYLDLQTRMIFTSYWCPPPASFGEIQRHPNVFAWVPTSSQSEVFLEQRFFESGTTGEDSQAGTLIHELSHNSTIAEIVDTDHNGDGETDYGTANAKTLATSDPAKARRTADNVQYFAEDLFWGI